MKSNIINEEIKKAEEKLQTLDISSKEYSTLVGRIAELEELKNKQINNKWFKNINVEQLTVGLLSLVEIALIMKFEKLDSITTKAFQFVKKPR